MRFLLLLLMIGCGIETDLGSSQEDLSFPQEHRSASPRDAFGGSTPALGESRPRPVNICRYGESCAECSCPWMTVGNYVGEPSKLGCWNETCVITDNRWPFTCLATVHFNLCTCPPGTHYNGANCICNYTNDKVWNGGCS